MRISRRGEKKVTVEESSSSSGRYKERQWPLEQRGSSLFERHVSRGRSYNNAILKGCIYSDNTAKGATRRAR